MFIDTYIFLHRGDVAPSSSIVNNYLASEITRELYTTVFSSVPRTFPDKESKFFNYGIPQALFASKCERTCCPIQWIRLSDKKLLNNVTSFPNFYLKNKLEISSYFDLCEKA